MKKAAIIFTILLVLGIIITYQLRDKKEKAPEIVYVPYTVTTADVKEVIDTTGEVSALNRVEIKPSVSGRVDRLLVNEGDTVRKGQVLAYLSSSDRVAILDAVRANPNENIKDWENTYKATPVISPMNGKIILRNVVEGQTISTNDILYALADELIVLASVDEADIGNIIKEIREVGYLDGTVFISFDINNLHYVRRFCPEQAVQYLAYDKTVAFFDDALRYGYDLDLHYSLVNAELIDACHKNGIKVNAWTVDDPTVAESLIAMGIDYITSNICE